VARRRDSGGAIEPERGASGWPHALRAALVVGSVGLTLAVGAALRAPAREVGGGADPSPDASLPTERFPETSPLPVAPRAELESPPPRTARDAPAPRAADDLPRRPRRESWTAQLALLCDARTAEDLALDFAGEERLNVLPVEHEGRACFQVSWGRYPDAEAARRASDLPPELRRLAARPYPKRLGEIVVADR